jgi:transcriptional regulator with XRE-family HTH domain
MDKSIYTDEYAVLRALLREAREAAGLTQVQLAKKVGQSQSFVSKAEQGDRRLDLIQLRTLCHALDTTLPALVADLERRLGGREGRRTRPRR